MVGAQAVLESAGSHFEKCTPLVVADHAANKESGSNDDYSLAACRVGSEASGCHFRGEDPGYTE